MLAWALNAFSSPFFLGAWLHRLRDSSPGLWWGFEKPCPDSLPSVGSCIQVLAVNPFLVWPTLQPWLCRATSCLEPDPVTWLQLDLSPAHGCGWGRQSLASWLTQVTTTEQTLTLMCWPDFLAWLQALSLETCLMGWAGHHSCSHHSVWV